MTQQNFMTGQSLSSITGSHRGYVVNRMDTHIEGKGSVFMRDEKQVLKNKKEIDRNEMRKALEAQIAEKKRVQEEEKKRRIQDDIRFERTMSQFTSNAKTPETVVEQRNEEEENIVENIASIASNSPKTTKPEVKETTTTPQPAHSTFCIFT